MSRSPSFPGTIRDERQLDLCEYIEATTTSRPFALWSDPNTKLLEVVMEGDRPINPRMQRIRAINDAVEAESNKLPD